MARPRLRAWLKPPRTLTVTRAGRTYLVITVGVGLGALNTGNNLLYLVLGLLLSTVVVSGVLSERCLGDLSVRRLPVDGARAGEPFALRWALARRKGVGFALTVAEADVEGLSAEGRLAVLRAGGEAVVRARALAGRRGPLALTGVRVTTTWPFGLFAKSRLFALPDTLLIYPRRGVACAEPAAAAAPVQGEGLARPAQDGGGDLAGLREVQPHEDARRVHWLRSASVGRPLRVLREREERRTYELGVDAALRGEALERRCEEVAALAQRLLAQGHEVGLSAGEARLRPAAGALQERRVLRALAWVGFTPPPTGTEAA